MIEKKLNRYVQVLNNIDDAQDKYLWIMDFGKNSKSMEDESLVERKEEKDLLGGEIKKQEGNYEKRN